MQQVSAHSVVCSKLAHSVVTSKLAHSMAFSSTGISPLMLQFCKGNESPSLMPSFGMQLHASKLCCNAGTKEQELNVCRLLGLWQKATNTKA